MLQPTTCGNGESMKVLCLYDSMRLGGPGYLHGNRFVEFLRAHTFLSLRYALVSDEFVRSFDHRDFGFSELIGTSEFFAAGFDTIIQSGQLFQTDGLCRINEDALQEFWRKGGVTVFLWHAADFCYGGPGETERRLERLRYLLGKGGHAHVSIYNPPGEGDYISGAQGQSDRVKITIDVNYLSNISEGGKELYAGVDRIVVEKPINLGPYCRWLCIGDKTTWMVNSRDLPSRCPPPLVFGGLSVSHGICVTITGHFLTDYVLEEDACDNMAFFWNVLNYCSSIRSERPGHVGVPTVFVSYSHADREKVDILCNKLESAGVRVWRDAKEIGVGQSITAAVEDGLRKTDYFLLVLSATSVESAWVEMEYRTALTAALKRKRLGMILPVVLDDTPVERLSLFLGDRKYADCTDIEQGVRQVLEVIGRSDGAST